jgi:CheY-like chemotaxis protein
MLSDDDLLRQQIATVHRAGERAALLTQQLLAFSRRQMLQPKVFNLNATVVEMGGMLGRIIGEDIDLTTVLEPRLERLKADPGQIEQVIMNLVVNAREAMPQGGKLVLKTENVILDQESYKPVPEARAGTYVCLSIADTGVGIDEQIIDQIFQPFFSTKEAGTGLGLAVVYGIVRQHEGWVDVYSEPGKGSTFRLYLPAFFEEAKDELEERLAAHELAGKGERILLAEDEEGVRRFVARVLTSNGYVVFEAASVEEAVSVFEREGGSFDLIFSDVVLPDRNGLELVDQLLPRKPELHILLSSGYTDEKSQWPAIRERGFRFLQKPYAVADLLRAVREALEPT